MNNRQTKVAIIGAGPAGCAAAIQLKRAGIDPILFEKSKIGGLALNANLIENYLGIEQGITGIEFGEKMEEQVLSLVIDTIFEEVEKITIKENQIVLSTKNTTCLCDYLVVATGSISKTLGVKGESEAQKRKLLFYEPISVPETKVNDSKIAIIGGSDAAFDYALNFAQRENEITIIHRSDKFICLPLLYYRVSNLESIELQYPKKVKEFLFSEDNKLDLLLDDDSTLTVDFALVAIGRKPNNVLLKDIHKELLENKIFTIGDLVNDKYRQISIAAGEGLLCAMKIIDLVNNKKKQK
ncbi:MAG: NAD(P)/FAD-dependent oxidoreductase [Candidatus Heimdallarchaeota archaeon]